MKARAVVATLAGAALAGGALIASPAGAAEPAAPASPFTVVAHGLNNPRGVAIDAAGNIYVAEAGKGGHGRCVADPEGGKQCVGFTGAITKVTPSGQQSRLIAGLPSAASADGSAASGPSDVAVNPDGNLTVVMQGVGTPAVRKTLGRSASAFGHLLGVSSTGKLLGAGADLTAFEAAHNPDGGAIDSDPYAVTISGNTVYVAEAAGNFVASVGSGGGPVNVEAVFPNRVVDAPAGAGLPAGAKVPMESVPNALATGPDGSVYVGELTGFPFVKGAARVFKLVPGSEPKVVATGFTNIIDVTVGRDGTLYVLEIAKDSLLSEGAPTGELTKIAPDGTKTVIASDGLLAPTGMALGADGFLYVSNKGILPGIGELVKIKA
ncbi:MAG: hypothetical protein JWL70_1741 [Acidimicrobiia bacterium]|nr:hypothetical protein [Acidimicrobiia bacterium]